MNVKEVLQNNLAQEVQEKIVVGIDIGSRQAKGVLLYRGNMECALRPTGYFMQQTAEELLSILCEKGKIVRNEIQYVVVTGYGRVSLTFSDIPYQTVTEIACHGKGAHYIGKGIRTIIDIGGQDSKAIRIDPEDGKVINFAMNDKCAAGTGRFLEKIANVLGYDVTEMGEASLRAERAIPINSTCVVFAESEVVSNRAKGESPENLAAGIHHAVAKRVSGLLSRVGIESNVLFTGGVSNNIGMKKAFEEQLQIHIAEGRLNTVFAGALGAAIFAGEYAVQEIPTRKEEIAEEKKELDISSFRQALQKAEDDFIHKRTGKKAYVAYTCNYTPIEIMAAANVSYMRLIHKGTQEEIIAGEGFTQSMQCDFAKSILGGFIKQTPVCRAVEKLYTFNTCACMRNTVETVKGFNVPVSIYNLPRRRTDESSLEYLTSEIIAFKEDLEELTGEKIEEDAIIGKVKAYNQAKRYMREIASYRKGDAPLLSSRVFQELMKGYYTLPVDVLLKEQEKILTQLKEMTPPKKKKIRLMLSGGIVADGDHKVTHILEETLDADIVVEDNCMGMKPLSFDIKEANEHVYQNIAEGYLGKAPCTRMYPLNDMLDYSLKLAQEYEVDGVILYYLKFCPCYSMVEKLYTDLYKKNNIPLLIISGDYSVGDEGQLKTRLEAYAEMLRIGKGSEGDGRI